MAASLPFLAKDNPAQYQVNPRLNAFQQGFLLHLHTLTLKDLDIIRRILVFSFDKTLFIQLLKHIVNKATL